MSGTSGSEYALRTNAAGAQYNTTKLQHLLRLLVVGLTKQVINTTALSETRCSSDACCNVTDLFELTSIRCSLCHTVAQRAQAGCTDTTLPM
jgi:hypothetical protein